MYFPICKSNIDIHPLDIFNSRCDMQKKISEYIVDEKKVHKTIGANN